MSRTSASQEKIEDFELPFQDLLGLVKYVLEGHDDLQQFIRSLSEKHHEAFWNIVFGLVGPLLNGPVPIVDTSGLGAQGAVVENAQIHRAPALALHAVASLLAVYADVALLPSVDVESHPLPPSFCETLASVQEMLLTIVDTGTQTLVAHVLEVVASGKFDGREDFFGGILMFLICNCLSSKGGGNDMARLYRLRHLFSELDWEHESIESIKMQIRRCIAHVGFLRSSHSADLVALFYAVHPSFTKDVHETIKQQVPVCRAGSLKTYSAGLLKAWKTAEEPMKGLLQDCLQDWAALAVRSSRKGAERARSMLEEIHRNHLDEDVNDALCKLYGPILWRSFKVANWQVRENAARLFQYSFPLIPSDFGIAEKEQELAKQLKILKDLLEDPAEPVRRVAVSVTCIILKTYWDMMPPGEMAELFTILYSRCAADKKSPGVRAAVCEGFCWLLENAVTHPTLSAVLPKCSALLNDRSPLVRAAFVNLLDVVSHCRGVSVAGIVSTDDLFARLCVEHAEYYLEGLQESATKRTPKRKLAKAKANAKQGAADGPAPKATSDLVAKLIAKLMAPSLFSTDIVQQVSRCLYFMKEHPLALLALFTHMEDTIPVSDRIKLGAALFRYGLREASNEGGNMRRVQIMLQSVGLLLNFGPGEVPQKRKRGGKSSSANLPEDVDKFVYEHIREDDFIVFLQSNDEEDISVREDLLFAVSSLKSERFPKTSRWLNDTLLEAVKEDCSHQSVGTARTLPALLRLAASWNQLGPVFAQACATLKTAAKRVSAGKALASNLEVTLTLLEGICRQPMAREALTADEALGLGEALNGVVEAFAACYRRLSKSFEGAFDDKGDMEAWCRILGTTSKLALHLQCRLEDASVGKGAAQIPKNFDDIVGAVADALGSDSTDTVLEACKARHTSSSGGSKIKGKRKNGKVAPISKSFEVLVRLHERMMEAVSLASCFRPNDVREAEGLGKVQSKLTSSLWKWTTMLDSCSGMTDPVYQQKAWLLASQLIQTSSEFGAWSDVLEAFVPLLMKTTAEVPNEEELHKVVRSVCAKMKKQPHFLQALASSANRPDFPERAASIIKEVATASETSASVPMTDESGGADDRGRSRTDTLFESCFEQV